MRMSMARQEGGLLQWLLLVFATATLSGLFVAWHRGEPGFADIVLPCLLIVATLLAFWPQLPLADAQLLG